MKMEIPQFASPPDLQAVDELKHWLLQISTEYSCYCERYSGKHNDWWAQQDFQLLLDWQIPAISHSRHLVLSQDVECYQQLKQLVDAKICRGIDILDYQPFCHCGFDGSHSDIVEDVTKLENFKNHIDQQIDLFF